ncbi:hypothetical protein SAMN04488072_102329 [Lentibacillus halodurans]|uniref:Sporulation lipoprotein YhcN/YlaJ (Spore_YhcN_YlaJ) n=1 Tax=Lentibacillus halodurans TaxID=237679 RepID=A0A1I0WAS4_9BACI|nr:hypothetical protein [Lentibacillus halodurans]SFA85378.1 hypothetical protein SAMN04488072_102329 [Lentibacillus halodurans]
MKKLRKKALTIIAVGIIMIFSACTNEQEEGAADRDNDANGNDVADNTNHHLEDPSLIPSETGDKRLTTSEDGDTNEGIGQNIYSSIGSSGVHEGGISSYFESILEGQGITGVKVFVIDDSVVLARNKEETTSHEYDNMQRELLSGTEGMSGRGEPEGVEDNQNESYDNLDQAHQEIDRMFNGNVKILTVTNPDAVDTIEQIKDNIMDSSYETASENLLKLLNMAD